MRCLGAHKTRGPSANNYLQTFFSPREKIYICIHAKLFLQSAAPSLLSYHYWKKKIFLALNLIFNISVLTSSAAAPNNFEGNAALRIQQQPLNKWLNTLYTLWVAFVPAGKINRIASDWLNNTLGNNTIKCKNLATIVSGRKYAAQPFVSRKQVNTSAE